MASSSLKGISISISDDDPDEPAKVRARVRPKRKKPAFIRGSAGIWPRIARKLEKWWVLLILLPSVALLFFEISRINQKSEDAGMRTKEEESPRGNLNRLDPTTRVVNGVRERKLLFQFLSFIRILGVQKLNYAVRIKTTEVLNIFLMNSVKNPWVFENYKREFWHGSLEIRCMDEDEESDAL